MSDKFQLHVSGLNMLDRCGVQFEFRYIRGIKIPPNVNITIGRAVDASVTADLGNKIVSGSLLPDEQIADIARDALVAGFAEGIDLEADYVDLGPEKAQDEAIDTSVVLSRIHHREAAPGIHPTHVQRPWTLDVDGLPIQIAGTIDVQEGLKAIRDTKTSKKSPAKEAAATSLQLTTYALAVNAHDGQPPEKVCLDYLVHTKKPQLVQLEAVRTKDDFPHLLNRIYQAHRIIESGLFAPAPVDAWWCSARWCGYWKQCRYAAHPVAA